MIKRFIDRQGSTSRHHRMISHLLCIPYDRKISWHLKGVLRELLRR